MSVSEMTLGNALRLESYLTLYREILALSRPSTERLYSSHQRRVSSSENLVPSVMFACQRRNQPNLHLRPVPVHSKFADGLDREVGMLPPLVDELGIIRQRANRYAYVSIYVFFNCCRDVERLQDALKSCRKVCCFCIVSYRRLTSWNILYPARLVKLYLQSRLRSVRISRKRLTFSMSRQS